MQSGSFDVCEGQDSWMTSVLRCPRFVEVWCGLDTLINSICFEVGDGSKILFWRMYNALRYLLALFPDLFSIAIYKVETVADFMGLTVAVLYWN